MVIYWFDCIDSLQEDSLEVLIATDFPAADAIVKLPCLLLPSGGDLYKQPQPASPVNPVTAIAC